MSNDTIRRQIENCLRNVPLERVIKTFYSPGEFCPIKPRKTPLLKFIEEVSYDHEITALYDLCDNYQQMDVL